MLVPSELEVVAPSALRGQNLKVEGQTVRCRDWRRRVFQPQLAHRVA